MQSQQAHTSTQKAQRSQTQNIYTRWITPVTGLGRQSVQWLATGSPSCLRCRHTHTNASLCSWSQVLILLVASSQTLTSLPELTWSSQSLQQPPLRLLGLSRILSRLMDASKFNSQAFCSTCMLVWLDVCYLLHADTHTHMVGTQSGLSRCWHLRQWAPVFYSSWQYLHLYTHIHME